MKSDRILALVAPIKSAVNGWNQVVQRGNYRRRPPQPPRAFDQWIAVRLQDDWFDRFLVWVDSWKQGGYGLYRDGE